MQSFGEKHGTISSNSFYVFTSHKVKKLEFLFLPALSFDFQSGLECSNMKGFLL